MGTSESGQSAHRGIPLPLGKKNADFPTNQAPSRTEHTKCLPPPHRIASHRKALRKRHTAIPKLNCPNPLIIPIPSSATNRSRFSESQERIRKPSQSVIYINTPFPLRPRKKRPSIHVSPTPSSHAQRTSPPDSHSHHPSPTQ